MALTITPLIPTTVLISARTAAVASGDIQEMELLPDRAYTFTATNLGASEDFSFLIWDFSLGTPAYQTWLYGGAQVNLTQSYNTITISGIHAIIKFTKTVTASASGLSYSWKDNVGGSIAPGITGLAGIVSLQSQITSLFDLLNSRKTSLHLRVLTTSDPRNSGLEATMLGRCFQGLVTCSAVAAKYSAVQIWNPANSPNTLLVASANGFNGSGTMKWYPLIDAVQLASNNGSVIKQDISGPAANFLMNSESLNARTSNPSFGISVAATTPGGTGLQLSSQFWLVRPGYGLRFECETVNIAANLNCIVIETPNADVSWS